MLPGNLPVSATFSSLTSPPRQGREGCADEGMVVLIGSSGAETLLIGVPGNAPGCCLGRGVLLSF